MWFTEILFFLFSLQLNVAAYLPRLSVSYSGVLQLFAVKLEWYISARNHEIPTWKLYLAISILFGKICTLLNGLQHIDTPPGLWNNAACFAVPALRMENISHGVAKLFCCVSH